jgi:putative transposase
MTINIPATKKELASALGISRSLMYYQHKLPDKDEVLKNKIEHILRKQPSYGHKRLALVLQANKKRILRVMKKYGLKPYRRRRKPFKYKAKTDELACENLIEQTTAIAPNQVWVSDFTEVLYKRKKIYIATIEDIFTRQIIGFSMMNNHKVQLIINALLNAVFKYPPSGIIHSDQGSEYKSKSYRDLLSALGIRQSMSRAGCPWENGYQESYYGKMKVDLGDPNRFETLGVSVYEIYQTIYDYNNTRIHTALQMPPAQFANQFNNLYLLESVSNKRGT